MDEVEVNVEHDGDLGVLADGAHGFQDPAWSRSGFQPALGGELVHQAVCQRVAEWNAQLEHIDAGPIERERQAARGVEIRIPGADVDDETFLSLAFQPGELFHDAIHAGGSFEF